MIYPTLYSSLSALEEIYRNNRELEAIIKKYCKLSLDIDNKEIQELIKVNPILLSLIKRPHIPKVEGSAQFVSILKENPSLLTENSGDIFIMPETIEEINKIRRNYGLMAISQDTLSGSELLTFHIRNSFKKNDRWKFEDEKNQCYGWAGYFKSKNLPEFPVNSILIADQYILNNKNSTENIVSIISALINKELKTDLQILLITFNKNDIYNKNKIDAIRLEIEKNLKSNLKINFKLGIICHRGGDIWHRRRLVTNYHFMTVDPGFNCFIKERVKNETGFELYGYYNGILDEYCKPGIELASSLIENTEKLFNTCKDNKFFINSGLEIFEKEKFRLFVN